MKAAQLVAPKRWEFTEIDTPSPDDGQVLVKMEAVSVCGSDIRHTYGPVLDESEYPMAPCKGAHELAGVIVDSKTDAFHEGQRVIVIPFPGTGGLCDYVLSEPGRIAVLPEYGGLDEWVMCQPREPSFIRVVRWAAPSSRTSSSSARAASASVSP